MIPSFKNEMYLVEPSNTKPLELIDIVQALEHLFLTNHCQKHIMATYENPQTFDKFELTFRKL